MPPNSKSLPSPPLRVSLPISPVSRSLPNPPLRLSSLALPVMITSPLLSVPVLPVVSGVGVGVGIGACVGVGVGVGMGACVGVGAGTGVGVCVTVRSKVSATAAPALSVAVTLILRLPTS